MADTLQAVVEGHDVTYNLSPTNNGKVTGVTVNDVKDDGGKSVYISIGGGGAYPPEVPGIIQRDLAQLANRPATANMAETVADDFPTDAGTPTTESDKNDTREVFPKVADGASMPGAQGDDTTVVGQTTHEQVDVDPNAPDVPKPQDENARLADEAGDGGKPKKGA